MTDTVIQLLSEKEPIVFVLWGKEAQKKQELIDNKHLKIMSAHPSPYSVHNGFFGSKPFSKANEFLEAHGKKVDWSLTLEI